MYLRWKMIDFKRACAFLPTSKSGEPRAVPLPDVIDSFKMRSKVRRPRRRPRVSITGGCARASIAGSSQPCSSLAKHDAQVSARRARAPRRRREAGTAEWTLTAMTRKLKPGGNGAAVIVSPRHFVLAELAGEHRQLPVPTLRDLIYHAEPDRSRRVDSGPTASQAASCGLGGAS
ncbi:MAG: hypothetical protein E6H67_18115 [Betaproteobacteria bacterium]|nr:MAG: hypothetical protein E6H67_18115 [Betaproteobacteria bacterium]